MLYCQAIGEYAIKGQLVDSNPIDVNSYVDDDEFLEIHAKMFNLEKKDLRESFGSIVNLFKSFNFKITAYKDSLFKNKETSRKDAIMCLNNGALASNYGVNRCLDLIAFFYTWSHLCLRLGLLLKSGKKHQDIDQMARQILTSPEFLNGAQSFVEFLSPDIKNRISIVGKAFDVQVK